MDSTFRHRCLLTIVVLAGLNAVNGQGARAGSALPSNMMRQMVAALPQTKHTVMRMLSDTLRMEAQSADHMRRFGRNGNRPNSFRFVQSFLGSTPHGKRLSMPSFVTTRMLSVLRSQFNLNNDQVNEAMHLLPSPLQQNTRPFVPDTPFQRPTPEVCPFPAFVQCNNRGVYRTYDGTCNNLQNPLWGSSHQPLSRIVAPAYADAISAPRISVTGHQLPNVRLISSTIHWDIDIPHHVHTLMLMQFGQFLDHDLSRTAISKLSMDPSAFSDDLEDVECGSDGCQTQGLENQACQPIPIPFNDTDFRGRPCLMFVRSQEAPNPRCTFGPREQLNQVTSHFDASHIYGSDLADAVELRDLSQPARGRMRMQKHVVNGRSYGDILPQDAQFKHCNTDNRTGQFCFKAGDGRVNEFMGLTIQHMSWAREHNRLEEGLHRVNPHWGGERLYQETRRIVTAVWQHLIYNEYLPVTLGPSLMQHYGLELQRGGHWNGYDVRVDPGVANSFATAAMRFGHSQIQGMMSMKNVDYSPRNFIPISTQFRRPQLMYNEPMGGSDAMLRSLIDMPAQVRDPFITKQVTRHLFSDDPPHGLGEDLMSLNMMRGREHGLPGYNVYRERCGLPRARQFDDLRKELPVAVIERFRRLYRHVDDIDLWPAGITEKPAPGSVVGPTFSCMLATQFRNLKYGDRFWYENNRHNPYPLTTAQLQEVRKMTIAKILCENADYVPNIQPWVLIQPWSKVQQSLRERGTNPSDTPGEVTRLYQNTPNERVPCQQLPDMDLRAWGERPPPASPARPQRPPVQPQHQQTNIIPQFPPKPNQQRPGTTPNRPPFTIVTNGNLPRDANRVPGLHFSLPNNQGVKLVLG